MKTTTMGTMERISIKLFKENNGNEVNNLSYEAHRDRSDGGVECKLD